VNGLSGVVEERVSGTGAAPWNNRTRPNGVPLKENHTPGSPSGMISVLYVDDESALLDIAKVYLEKTNDFSVTTATSAQAGVNRLKSNGIQAIVSDYQMPEVDGIEFLKQVRATDKSIPFIIFTGKGREEIAIKAFENGADFYLQKGGDPKSQFAELSHKIHAAVDHRRADMQVTALTRLYAVLSATNKAIVRIHDKTKLLNEICRIVVDIGGFTMAWAGRPNVKKHLIKPVASYGHINGYLDTIAISTEDDPQGRGPTGTTFRTRTFFICNDIANDPAMEPWREEALKRGYRSSASFPFALDTKNAGVISFYASEPGFFTDQIIRLLDEQSGDISFALVTLDHEEQRKSAENDLKTSELRYRRLFETAQDAILILDGDTGEVIDANTFILDMLGYPLEYFVGKHLWELGFVKDKSIAQQVFTELQTNSYIRDEDLPLETADGRSIDVEFISNAYLVGDKKIIQCNIRNITDKKVVQDALQASELQYRRLFETAQDGILILDEETGKIIDANKFLLDLLGYPLEYFVSKHLWELGFIKDKSITQHAFTELKTNGYIRYDDLPLETKDGRSIDVEFVSNVYPVNHHKIIQCNIRDITDRKRVEEEIRLHQIELTMQNEELRIIRQDLQVSRDQYMDLYDMAPVGYLTIRENGLVIKGNLTAATLVNVEREKLINAPVSRFIVPDDQNTYYLHRKNLTDTKQQQSFELRIQRQGDGSPFWAQIIMGLAQAGEGDTAACNLIIIDITGRKQVEYALQQANKQLNLLSSITRHDIKNQLMVLKGYLELSEEVIDKPETLREFIKKEQQAVSTIERQIMFTKNYQDLGAAAPEWQSVNASIKKAVAGLPMRAVHVDVDPKDPAIFADPLFEKVFYNLIDNALRYAGDQMKTIRVSSQESDASLTIICEDDGVGISAEDKKKLFTRGFGKNTGLGLFLSQEILSITGITITENGTPGKGARFEITVPKGMYRFGRSEGH